MIGTKLAHYEITSHLGTGGMGEAYQATDLKLGRSATTGEFAFRNPRTLQLPANTLMYQSYRDFDVTSSGDKFVVIVAEQKDAKAGAPAPALRIDVVLNWFEELKARFKVP